MSPLMPMTISDRDQICAILRYAGEPLSAEEIALQMPPYRMWHSKAECEFHAHRMPPSLTHWRGWEHVNGSCYLLMDFPVNRLHPNLRALADAGQVRRSGPPRGKGAMWEFIGPLVDVSDLEVALQLTQG